MQRLDTLFLEMTRFYAGQPGRIQHFVKVHSFAALIGKSEGLGANTQYILEAAAYVHDIGIKLAESKYGSAAGPLQEKEGPPAAKDMLEALGFDANVTARVCYLVSRHHTYTEVDGVDYRILLEADALVNLYESGASEEAIRNALDKVFETQTGKTLCQVMFGL